MNITRGPLTVICWDCHRGVGDEVEAIRKAQELTPEYVRCPFCLQAMARWYQGKMRWLLGVTFREEAR